MILTNKSSAILIICGALSPFITCVAIAIFLSGATAATLAAAYAVFGLFFVLVIGWLLSLGTKNSHNPLFWTTLAYLGPALLLNIAIIGIATNS